MSRQEAARRHLSGLIDVIHNVSTLLLRPASIHVANVGLDAPSRPHYTVDGRSWPTAADLARALIEWDEACYDVRRAWHTLDEQDRKLVSAPSP